MISLISYLQIEWIYLVFLSCGLTWIYHTPSCPLTCHNPASHVIISWLFETVLEWVVATTWLPVLVIFRYVCLKSNSSPLPPTHNKDILSPSISLSINQSDMCIYGITLSNAHIHIKHSTSCNLKRRQGVSLRLTLDLIKDYTVGNTLSIEPMPIEV